MQDQPPAPHLLANQFRELVAGFGLCLAHSKDTSHRHEVVFRDLLTGFLDRYARASSVEAAQVVQDLAAMKGVLGGYLVALENWKQNQKGTADEFDLLEVMHLTGREIRYSMVLAWLLDHDLMRLGTHAQGSRGFKLFLKELKLPTHYATPPYRVRREVSGDQSRVDVEVAAQGRFLIHIENKIEAREGPDQTDREWADVQLRVQALGIPGEPPDWPVHAIFLTPDGKLARNHNFMRVSWRQIAKVLDEFAATVKPPDVKLFASHFARSLYRSVIPDFQNEEKPNGEATI